MTTDAKNANAALDRRLAAALRERGQRVTSQRLLIHRALRKLNRHVTAEELLDAVAPSLPSVSLPTVYASLELFEELGIVRRVRAGAGAVRFDPRAEKHHHLACRRCGRVEDLDVAVDLAPALRAAERARFSAEATELVVSGLCATCAARS
jgi:Fe2+ or Zn2+ uptake regulation protein